MHRLCHLLLRFKTAAYEGYELNSAQLTKGKVINAAMASGFSYTVDLLTGGDSELTVTAIMTGAANGDLVPRLGFFEADGVTVSGIGITPIRQTAPTFLAGTSDVQWTGTYDVSGVDKVRIFITNTNVGAQTLRQLQWRLS